MVNVSSNNQTEGNPHYRSHVTIMAQVTSLGVLGGVIVLGNLASIVTFLKTQALRRRSSYLIINLSVADLLVGFVVFPVMYFFLTGIQFNTFTIILEFLETITGMASILIMSTIAAERLHAICAPFSHRMLRFKFYPAICLFPWLVSSAVCSLYLIAYLSNPHLPNLAQIYFIVHPAVLAVALIIIIISYIAIWIKSRQPNPSDHNQNRVMRDRRLAVTLFIVTLASLVTWLPYQCLQNIIIHCTDCPLPHINILFIIKFLQFSNSGINFFIYMMRMREFRSAFFFLVTCSRAPNRTNRLSSTTFAGSISVLTMRISENKQNDVRHSWKTSHAGFSHRKAYSVDESVVNGCDSTTNDKEKITVRLNIASPLEEDYAYVSSRESKQGTHEKNENE